MTAEGANQNLEESARTAVRVRGDATASLVDRARADAILLQREGEIEEAIEKWRSIATAVEEDRQLRALAWCSIGYLRSVGEGIDWEAAMVAYTKAIELNPAYAGAYNNRGNVKKALDRREEAIADYSQAIKLNPTDPGLYNNRGMARYDLRQYEAAFADFNRSIELNPAYAEAYNSRGVANVALRRTNEAREDFQKALDLAQCASNEDVVEKAEYGLRFLANNEAP